jgi:hypothetical protein
MQATLLPTVSFFLFIFLSGILVRRSGKPYPVLMFTVHKLVSLATFAFLVVILFQMDQATPLTQDAIIVAIVTAFLFVDTIIAGGLASIAKPISPAIPLLHKVLPCLTVLSTAITLYLVLNRA